MSSAPSLGYAGFVSPTVLRVKGFGSTSFPARNGEHMFTFSMLTAKRSSGSIRPSSWPANFGLKPKQLTEVQTLIEEHRNEIRAAWAKHFPSGSH
jgi:hypothetical protein